MKIAISTPGRFHNFDQAAALYSAGVLDKIYSAYPRYKLRGTGVPDKNIVTLGYLQTIHVGLSRFALGMAVSRLNSAIYERVQDDLDREVALRLGDVDVLIAQAGSGFRSGLRVQRSGGKYVVDRGSTHILFQDAILYEESNRLGVPVKRATTSAIQRELSEYALADAILLPSKFALESYLEYGIPRKKLKLVQYGINFANFQPSHTKAERFRVLFAGQVGFRKGIHYLLSAWKQWGNTDAELRIVGAVQPEMREIIRQLGGLPPGVTFVGHMPQQALVREMSEAHVLVLPSLEEGLALVMLQAMACGTPVIATHNTGAGSLFENGTEGFVGPARSTEYLLETLQAVYEQPDRLRSISGLALKRVHEFGGRDAYGHRILEVVREIDRGV